MWSLIKSTVLTVILLLCVLPVKAQTSCNTLLFWPSDHIRNGSLEQINTACEKYLFTDTSSRVIPMKYLVPFWQSPIFSYNYTYYLGICNGFTLGYDDATYDRNRSPGDNSHLIHLPIVPQPIPDGKGVLGLLSNRSLTGTPGADLLREKDYICTNLFRTLKKDSTYRLDFALGFGLKDTLGEGYYVSDRYVRFTLFGLADSSKAPFFIPANKRGANLGCLTQNFPDWVPLGSVVITGDKNTWVKASLVFTASSDFQTIAIGPACDMSDLPVTPLQENESGYFYFLDNLRFYQASSPKPIVEVSGGSYCAGPGASLTLHLQSADYYKGSKLQWYQNGQALAGETGSSLVTTPARYGPGWYQCGVQNDSLCIRSDSLQVFWDPDLSSLPGPGDDTTACNGDTVTLSIHGGMSASYKWSTGATDSSIHITQAGAYSIDAVNACSALHATKHISFKDCPPDLWVPSAFSPNHDGRNDVFRAHAHGQIQQFRLRIFNRFGQLLFQTSDINQGWDGNLNGLQQGTGAYIWMADYADGSGKKYTQQGTVVLIR
jgi:gliding motility-associated-like protein